MKKLYVIGQSTCYGMDLKPGKSGLSMREYRETKCFAGLLGKQLGYEVINSSYPMSSLSTVIRQIKNEYDTIHPDISIVGIPQATLREIWDPIKESHINIMFKEFYFPKTVLHPDDSGVPKIYDTEFQRKAYIEYRDGLTIERAMEDYERDVIELQVFLDSRNAKYVFLQMAPIIPNMITADGYTDIENPIKQFTQYFKNLDFINTDRWVNFDLFNAVDNLRHCIKGKTGHVLEDGHEILKDVLYDKIINSGLSD